jgi:hypothetical protein
MAEATFTLRELFDVDVNDLAVHAEPGVDVYQGAAEIRDEIHKASRAIRWKWVRDVLAKKSAEALDLNVIDVLLDAWKKYMQIAEYQENSRKDPQGTFLCPLAEHTVTSEHHPYVEILLRDHPIGKIVFDLEFSLTLEGFVLKIQDGAIFEIQAGSAKGKAALSLAKTVLLKRELQPVRFPGHIQLRKEVTPRAPEARSAAAGSPS